MKQRLRNLLLGIPLILGMNCATIKPKGSIEVAYVPKRIDDHIEENEIKLSLDTRLEFPTRIGDFYIGFIGTGYGGIDFNDSNKGLNPHRIESTGYAGWRKNNLEIYAKHNSNHPINEEEIHLNYEGKGYVVNDYDGMEEIGIRLKF